jgi:hypothetical protein
MGNNPNQIQVDPEKIQQAIEKYKLPFVLVFGVFFFSGPLMSLLNIFSFFI